MISACSGSSSAGSEQAGSTPEAVLPAAATGIAAHSRGAGLSARFIADFGGIAAWVSLSGHDMDPTTVPVPKLLTWGSNNAIDIQSEVAASTFAQERSEYETYVSAIDLVAILQAKARAMLARSAAGE